MIVSIVGLTVGLTLLGFGARTAYDPDPRWKRWDRWNALMDRRRRLLVRLLGVGIALVGVWTLSVAFQA